MKLYWFFLILPLVTSCLSTKKFRDRNHPPLTKENIGKINGDYDPKAYGYFKYFSNKRIKSAEYVSLTVLNESTINAKLMNSSEVISQKTVKGHINEDGYFSIRKKTIIIPLPFVEFYHGEKSDIIITDNGKLLIAHCEDKFGFFLIIPMGTYLTWNETFSKIR